MATCPKCGDKMIGGICCVCDIETAQREAVAAERGRCEGLIVSYARERMALNDRDPVLADLLDCIRSGAPAPKQLCQCQWEAGDSPCPMHDCQHGTAPADCDKCAAPAPREG